MEKKYKLTEDFIFYKDKKLYRIQALKDFKSVKAGDLGGYIEKESNLSHEGNCWAYDNAKVYHNPQHYQLPIQPIDYIVKNNLDFLEGNVIKYVSRYKQKNGLEDLLKAKKYLELLIEKEEKK